MEDKQKLVQFITIFNLLNKNKPMINYKYFKPLYEFLKLWSNPKKHYSDGFGWEIVKQIQNEIIKTTKHIIQNSNFFFLHVMRSQPWITQVGQVCI
jgi:hypothetical protein